MTLEAVTVDQGLLRNWPLAGLGEGEVGAGSLLIVGGSRVTPGAVLLSALAALRAGAGKVQVLTARSAAAALAVAVPELLVAGAEETEDGELDPGAVDQARELAKGVDVVLVGPGLMSPRAAVDFCRPLLPTLQNRLVVDALALAYFAERDAADRALADGRVVLTPNTGEVALALDVAKDDLEGDEDQGAGRLARRHGAVVTAGGATTWIASPDGRRWVDRAGHPAMSASGSGDSKAGVVAAFFTRTDDPVQAAVWGGAVHALAGERAAQRIGPVGYLAREVVDEVPSVIADLCRPGS
jgi:ADP-dependent NAD(P)H-hydrate dehydratase